MELSIQALFGPRRALRNFVRLTASLASSDGIGAVPLRFTPGPWSLPRLIHEECRMFFRLGMVALP